MCVCVCVCAKVTEVGQFHNYANLNFTELLVCFKPLLARFSSILLSLTMNKNTIIMWLSHQPCLL